jgi:predicted RNA binding protein YcfA (HicA-like mRNA interferase family)
MSGKLPALTAAEILRALRRAGFTVERVKGSHHHLRHAARPASRVVVLAHRGDLPTGTVNAILRQAGLSREELLRLLRSRTAPAGSQRARWAGAVVHRVDARRARVDSGVAHALVGARGQMPIPCLREPRVPFADAG